jgi:parvulin-like peptidyl-prolyl isomerase
VNRIVAIVNDEIITEADVVAHVRSILEEHDLPDPTQAESLEVQMMVLRNLIEQRLILQEAKKLGVIVGPEETAQRLEALRARAGSEEQFQQRLAESSLTEEALREKIRDQLLVQRVIEAKVRSTIVVTPLEVSRALAEQPNLAKPGERVRARHVLVRVNDERSEAQARALMTDLHRQLADGADFAALAKRYSEDPNAQDGGVMEWVAQGELMPELDAVLFTLPVGSVSEPIQTRLGFHLLKVEERRTASELSVTEANRAVYQQLYQQKFEAAMKRWLSDLKSRAYIQIL